MRPRLPGTEILAPGLPKFAWFGRLKNSKRSWVSRRSLILVFFRTLTSNTMSPGPKRMLRAELPKAKGAGTEYPEASNQRVMLRSLRDRLPTFVTSARVAYQPVWLGLKV